MTTVRSKRRRRVTVTGLTRITVGALLQIGATVLSLDSSHAQLYLELEGSAVFPGYNDASIPNRTGTRFSFTDDFRREAQLAARARLSYEWGRHHLSVMAAPLTVETNGTFDRDVLFDGNVFATDLPVAGTYRFDSYRATYRYTLAESDRWLFGIGITAKVRDAEISLKNSETSSRYTNLGVVPLLNFDLRLMLSGRWYLRINGDALAAPQGRAEDILAAVELRLNTTLKAMAGYRFLEGGADVDDVYSFALFHYAVLGLTMRP